MRVETGQPEEHPGSGAQPLPYDPALSPGVAPETYIEPDQLHGPTVDARDTTGEYAAQLAAGWAECAAAQVTGQDARNAMLAHYREQALPLGSTMGDLVQFPPGPLDPGAGAGNTAAAGAFYDPPRIGASYDYTQGPGFGGEQGAPPPAGYQDRPV